MINLGSHAGIKQVIILGIIAALISTLPEAWTNAATVPAYEITTRGNLEHPRYVQGSGHTHTYPLLDIEQLKNTCPIEILIFVHGRNLTESKAKERFDRVKMSLEHNNYTVPIIGFSWDSNISWFEAKSIAKDNRPRLAQFITDYKVECKNQHRDSKVRLIGHSLGSRVILGTLASLNKNPTLNNITNNFAIASVHLMGATVDDEVSKESVNHFNPRLNAAGRSKICVWSSY